MTFAWFLYSKTSDRIIQWQWMAHTGEGDMCSVNRMGCTLLHIISLYKCLIHSYCLVTQHSI